MSFGKVAIALGDASPLRVRVSIFDGLGYACAVHEIEQMGTRWIGQAWCARAAYALALELGGAGWLCISVDKTGAHARLEPVAPDDSAAWTSLAEAAEHPWYRQDLGLTTLRVIIDQGVPLSSVRVLAPSGDDAQVKLSFAGARSFVLYADAVVDEAGRLAPRLRSRWEEMP